MPNDRSSWDKYWYYSYGGYNNPDPGSRRNFIPINFVPRQNPFYVALPYNDVEGGHTKYEASRVIPWFKQVFVRDGQTVLKGRWIAVHHGNKVCYAQWEDCGPFRTDQWQYVFGNERPRPNLNQGAGLAFAYVRARAITENLIELLIEEIRRQRRMEILSCSSSAPSQRFAISRQTY